MSRAFQKVALGQKLLIFIFKLLCGASKGFRKAFKAFTKPFVAGRRSLIYSLLRDRDGKS